MNTDWWKENFPSSAIRSVSELIDERLNVTSASGSLMSFDGYVECRLTVGNQNQEMVIPMLASKMIHRDKPIIGYNVIQHSMALEDQNDSSNVMKVFPGLSGSGSANLVKAIQTNAEEKVCVVRTGKKNEIVAKGTQRYVRFIVPARSTESNFAALFQPAIGDIHH